MTHSNIPSAQTIVSLCEAYGIEHVVISPGSRSAPLTIEFTNNNTFKCYSIVDERCAGFFALGMAQQLQKPVALVCTSGSALLNYYPAISEAFYSHIPLIVLSADRPQYLVDIGDGQTVKQPKVYGEHVYYSTNLKLDVVAFSKNENNAISTKQALLNQQKSNSKKQQNIQHFNEAEIKNAIETSLRHCGPVHINIPFNEPLYNTTNQLLIKAPVVSPIVKTTSLDENDLNEATTIWNKHSKKLVLVGVLQPNSIQQYYIDTLVNNDSVIIFTETTSNLHHEEIFPSIDTIIAPLESTDFKKLQPDIVLTIGGMIVSKKIKALLRQYQPKHHWHIGETKANDTFFCLTKHFKVTPNTFFKHFLPKIKAIKSNYKAFWLAVKSHRKLKHNAYVKHIPFSDFTVFKQIINNIPLQSVLHVGNSSAIRYTQLFTVPKGISVFCNRGTSGIDGSTSTAIGASVVLNQQVTFITGDLSFFYDSNALWNAYIPKSFRIIVVNNQGGGIFRILPGHKNTSNFDTYFETKHQLTAKQLCAMYGLEYHKAINSSQLSERLQSFYTKSDKPKLLEVFTPSQINDEVLLHYFKYLKSS